MYYCNSVNRYAVGLKLSKGFPVYGGFSGINNIPGVLGGRGVLRAETSEGVILDILGVIVMSYALEISNA